MKYIYIIFIWVLAFMQVQQMTAQCVNGTSTNPAAPTPANAGFDGKIR